MPAMITPLQEFSNNGNSRTYNVSGHSLKVPRLLKQARTIPTGAATVAVSHFILTQGTTDADGVALRERFLVDVKVRTPINGQNTDRDKVIALLRDLVNSDGFNVAVQTQVFIPEIPAV